MWALPGGEGAAGLVASFTVRPANGREAAPFVPSASDNVVPTSPGVNETSFKNKAKYDLNAAVGRYQTKSQGAKEVLVRPGSHADKLYHLGRSGTSP